jgi:hypothetical protein
MKQRIVPIYISWKQGALSKVNFMERRDTPGDSEYTSNGIQGSSKVIQKKMGSSKVNIIEDINIPR